MSDISYGVKFINPDELINQLEFSPGMKIADFGCGTGYFAFPLAKKVGEEGIVYALDVLKEKLETVESQAKLKGLTNIIASRVNLEKEGGSKLEDESVDWVIMVNMLFQNSHQDIIIAEAKRVLKKGGKMLIIEWNEHDSSIGPEGKIKISKETLIEMAQKNDLAVSEELPVGDFHYGLVLVK